MVPRFFCPQPLAAGGLCVLPEAAAHHAGRVLRLAPGDAVCVFDGRGGEYAGRIDGGGRELRCRILAHDPIEREAPVAITLVQALPSGERMDWLVQKAVELGVAAIVPVLAERCVVRLSGERAARRRAHWRQIAVSACEQCGRNRIPEVAPVVALGDFLAESGKPGDLRLLLDPQAGRSLRTLPATAPMGVVLLAGPEGGFVEAERRAAAECGFRALTLGPRVLRAETAGLAATAALLARWGDY
ncbi:MAG: 16S rRNA (uracil(1498)-N(3))-methyltransferase [Rhodocyclaceae bacterium]